MSDPPDPGAGPSDPDDEPDGDGSPTDEFSFGGLDVGSDGGTDGEGDGGTDDGDGGEATYDCDNCGRTVAESDAIRGETMGNLDPDKWQTLSCPDCGTRLKTVFVGLDDLPGS